MNAEDLRALPQWDGQGGWIYAVVFSDGLVKVGATRSLQQRAFSLQARARKRGAGIVGLHHARSPRNRWLFAVERQALAICRNHGPTVGRSREWFASVPFTNACAAVDAAVSHDLLASGLREAA